MDENTTNIIKERFDSLPENIKELILSSHYEETLIEIGGRYHLNVEKLGILERETTMVMLGLTNPNNYENDLTRELNIEKSQGNQIVKEINEKIFFRIRELLKLMNTPQGEEPSMEEFEEKPEDRDAQILRSAGIEIIEQRVNLSGAPSINEPDLTRPELSAPQNIPTPPSVTSSSQMLAQKFSGSFQIPSTKTEYTVPNVSKPQNSDLVPKKPGVDPYREMPE